MFDSRYLNQCREWLSDQFEILSDSVQVLLPSQWASATRWLPRSVTPRPGFYDFELFPYLEEIVDCGSVYSPVRQVDFMKGVQVGATAGVLENLIGYVIDHVKSAPCMLVTADAELASLRMDAYVVPMLQHSNLNHLIKSNDELSTRKAGKTDKKMEWVGGGFLIPLGAQNANKLRSTSIQYLLKDEVDGWPDKVGKDGDPYVLVDDRTAAFEATRKIINVSTPLITQTSRIYPGYLGGDRRKYMVPCKHCRKKQELIFNGVNDDGTFFGLKWDLDTFGNLVSGSVRYVCRFCQGEMVNEDKTFMLAKKNGAIWEPTATPLTPNRRSYHLPALYSPPGFRTWEAIVARWLAAWDSERNRPRDMRTLQQFYNNDLGMPFEMRGEGLKFERVVAYRRGIYRSGEIPNTYAIKETGAPVQLLTCAVDVHKTHLDVQVIGWCRAARYYSIEWLKFEGNCEDIQDASWHQLRQLIEHKTYVADDGKRYRVVLTLIDSQYNSDLVYRFCAEYTTGVCPIAGRELPPKQASLREFSPFPSKYGVMAYNVTVTIYKDRLAIGLKLEWDGVSLQPPGFPNFPHDYPDTFFKELSAESKKERKDELTGQSKGFFWHRPSGAANHSWDLTVYNAAALDMLALTVSMSKLNCEYIDWIRFWELVEKDKLYYTG